MIRFKDILLIATKQELKFMTSLPPELAKQYEDYLILKQKFKPLENKSDLKITFKKV